MIEEKDLKLLIKALSFSANKHKDQRRKDVDASPYINHPISLVAVLCNEAHIFDVDVICGALLHDTVEDTDTTFEELTTEFGSVISDIVNELSDDKNLSKLERKQQQIEHAAHASDKAKLVKYADKIANLRDITNSPPQGWSLERRQKYFDWAKQVVDQLNGSNADLEKLFMVEFGNRPIE